MQEAAATGLALTLVLALPGLLAVVAARVRMSIVEIVALVPVVSLGVLWIAAEVVDVIGVAWSVPVYAATMVLLAALAVWRTWSPRDAFVVDLEAAPPAPSAAALPTGPRAPRLSWGTRPRIAGVTALALLLIGIGLGGATWVRAVRGHDTIPPAYDASQHAFFVSRIEASGATDASTVVVSDPRGRDEASDYYPLALHSALAAGGEVTGAEVPDLLTGMVILMGALILPCGLYALGRRLVPAEPLVAGFAAVLASLFSLFPYAPIMWGGITLIVGVALLPAVVVLLERVVGRPLTLAGGALAAVCVMSVFAVHNSQVPMLGLMVVLLLVEVAVLARSWRVLGDAAVRLVIVGVGALVLFAPTLVSFFGGVSERSDFHDTTLVPLEFVVGKLVMLDAYVASSQGWLALLALVGAGVLLWRRRATWVVGTAIVLFLVVAAAISNSFLVGALTFPWYRQPARIAYYLVYFVPILGAMTLALGCGLVVGLAARWPRTRTWLVPLTAVVALAVVATVGGRSSTRVNRAFVTSAYTQNTPVGPAQVAAFDWLSEHSPRDGLILTVDNADGGVWMYTFSDANPLFAAYPQKDSPFHDRSVRERDYIREHITDLGHDRRLAHLLDRYRIRYLYFGERAFIEFNRGASLAALRATPGLREVFTLDGAHVFEISRR